MNNIHTKAKDFEQVFISIEKTIELILSGFDDEQSEHTQNIMNKRFFKNQTCLVRDGYDLDNINITDDSTPSYTDLQNAIKSKLAGKNSPLLQEYGFSKKRTLDNLQSMGVVIPPELMNNTKSFIQDDDFCDDSGAYLECLPHEYALLYKDYETDTATLQAQLDQANERITELEQQLAKKNSTPANLPCFDKDNVYTYPPELDMAVKIWTEIYQTDHLPKHLSHHSDKFRQACKNLGFSFAENAVETRLKKVTTPKNQKDKTKK